MSKKVVREVTKFYLKAPHKPYKNCYKRFQHIISKHINTIQNKVIDYWHWPQNKLIMKNFLRFKTKINKDKSDKKV